MVLPRDNVIPTVPQLLQYTKKKKKNHFCFIYLDFYYCIVNTNSLTHSLYAHVLLYFLSLSCSEKEISPYFQGGTQ